MQAERDQKIDEAIRLYSLVSAEARSSDPRLASWALQKAHYLAYSQRTYGAVPAAQAQVASVGGNVRLNPPPGAVSGNALPRDPNSTSVATVSTGPSPPPVHSFRGRLVLAGRSYQGERMYRLEPVGTLTYVVAGPGIDLEVYRDRVVEVFGSGFYHGGLCANLVKATRVVPLP
jgi:hypothetical protein